MKRLLPAISIFIALAIVTTSNIANAQVSSTDIEDEAIVEIWSEPEGGTLYSEILVYANFCEVIENYNLTSNFLNITSIVTKPDGQTERLSEFAETDENNCNRVPARSLIPVQSGDYTVRVIAHIDDYDVGSNSVTIRVVSEGIFQNGKVTVVLDSDELRALDHSPDPAFFYGVRVLDWSSDGKSILFGYHDYADTSTSQMDSLAIIDVQTFDITKLDVLNVNENNTKEIYLAKFSPSSDSVFILLGNKSQYPGRPEDIFKYDLEDRTLSQITNSSNVDWFDTLANVDGATLIYISDHTHLWPTDDEKISRMIQSVAGKYYYLLPDYLANTFGTMSGSLDINEDASKLVFTGPATLLDPGIILVDVQSGEEKKITSRNPCVASVEFAPNDDLILYSEHPGQSCLEPSPDLGASLRIASLDGTIDEIVYNDKRAVPNAVLSPDGRFAATVGYAYSIEDQFPKILLVELSRPVPEFGSVATILITTASLASMVIIIRLARSKLRI